MLLMKKEENIILITILVLIAIIISLSYFFYSIYSFSSEEIEISNNTVIEIIDGDTFKLYSGETIRLLCINTPEKGQKGYEDAKTYLESMLLNKEVRLYNPSQEEYKDKYGRSLRYVYLTTEENEILINADIITNQYGKLYIYNDTDCYYLEEYISHK